MLFPGKRCWARLCALLAIGVGVLAPSAGMAGTGTPAESALALLRPDYRDYIGSVRPLSGKGREAASHLYMALVRPGADDPGRRDNAPFAGSGARNDILYDPSVMQGGRSGAWVSLLLDHEYFHARHLAGATSLPLLRRLAAAVERHYFEAAAWGFNVQQARAGRYPGLRESEFREALDRYGEHFRALRGLAQEGGAANWDMLPTRLMEPLTLITTAGSRPPASPGRPSAAGR